MQQQQVLLRSDHFYLFAGLGPMVEGYIIIAPHRCDWENEGLKTISEAPMAMLDEIMFLRGLVSLFYRNVYKVEAALCFEHGRAGTCGVSDTPHCYHAHLCCFPVGTSIWKDVKIPRRKIRLIDGLGQLGMTAGRNPYLLVQECVIHADAEMTVAAREGWTTRAMVLQEEGEVPRQYLRKLLAARLGMSDVWDWGGVPDYALVDSLCTRFRQWLANDSGLPVTTGPDSTPCLDFMAGVRAFSNRAYDAVAEEFDQHWRDPSPRMVETISEFIAFAGRSVAGAGRSSPARVLDLGCGPGIYLKYFAEAGFDCTGVDTSKEMLSIARDKIKALAGGVPAIKLDLRQQDGFDLRMFPDASFDAIWHCALMVHLPRAYAQAALSDLRRLLRPEGILYLSAQAGGDAVLRRDGRFFIYYSEDELEACFRSSGFSILKRWHDTTHRGTCGDRRTKRWINYFLKVS